MIGSIHLDYIQRPPSHRLEIIGTQSTIRWDNADGVVERFNTSEENWRSYSLPAGFDRNGLFLAEMRHFLDLIQDRVAAKCTLEDGIWSQKLVQGVHDSAREGQLVSWGGRTCSEVR